MTGSGAAGISRCHHGQIIAIGLCQRCGLREAQAERNRRNRAERREQAAERFQKRREEGARHWQAPIGWVEPEDVT